MATLEIVGQHFPLATGAENAENRENNLRNFTQVNRTGLPESFRNWKTGLENLPLNITEITGIGTTVKIDAFALTSR